MKEHTDVENMTVTELADYLIAEAGEVRDTEYPEVLEVSSLIILLKSILECAIEDRREVVLSGLAHLINTLKHLPQKH